MKITARRLESILRRYDQLNDLALQFAKEVEPYGQFRTIRIESNGQVEEEVNTACNCHPEYEWVPRGTPEQFSAWLEKNT